MYRTIVKSLLLCWMFSLGTLHATWSAPMTVDVVTYASLIPPQIAVDRNGNAVAVWFNESQTVIEASSRTFGGLWQAKTTLSQLPIIPYGSTMDAVFVAMDSYGNATAIWTVADETQYAVQASTKLFGQPWQTEPDTLSSDPVSGGTPPHIAVDSNGNATVVWLAYVEDLYSLQSSTKPFGGTWQAPVTVSSEGTDASFANIAVDGNGNATAIWTGTLASIPIVQAATKPFGQAWQAPVTLAEGAPKSGFPQIVIDSYGNATAVWQRTTDTQDFIQASTKPFNGTWQEIADTIPGSEQVAGIPRPAVDSKGNVTVVWEASANSDADRIIQASTKPFNGVWQETPDTLPRVFQLNARPQIVIDALGNTTVVWQTIDATTPSVQAATKSFGETWPLVPETLPSPGQFALSPTVAVDGSNNVTAIWYGRSGVTFLIQTATNSFGLTVTDVRPTSGPKKGGNAVTITGTNFINVSAVYFGGTPSQTFTVDSPTTITAVVPHGRGIVDVTVTTPSETSPTTVADQYTYRWFHGKVKHGKHGKKKLLLKSQWNKTVSPNVTTYEIFARNKKIISLPVESKPQAVIRLHPHHLHHNISNTYRHYLQHKYKIRAVDADGTVTAFSPLEIQR